MKPALTLITLKNPVSYQVGVNKKGDPIFAYTGEIEDSRITLTRPVTIVVGRDDSGNDIQAFIGVTAQKALAEAEKRGAKPSTQRPRKRGYWEGLILETVKETPLATINGVLANAESKAPKGDKKYRTRFFCRRALDSLKAKGELQIENGLVSEPLDSLI